MPAAGATGVVTAMAGAGVAGLASAAQAQADADKTSAAVARKTEVTKNEFMVRAPLQNVADT